MNSARWYFGSLALAAALIVSPPSLAGDAVSGTAKAIDGDTVVVAGQRFRLTGIDAPEPAQNCALRNGNSYRCGKVARTALLDLIAGTKMVCVPIAGTLEGEPLARCRAGGFDVSRNMVHTGWALAYPPDTSPYTDTEAKARKAKRGLWQGRFIPPWKWRPDNRK